MIPFLGFSRSRDHGPQSAVRGGARHRRHLLVYGPGLSSGHQLLDEERVRDAAQRVRLIGFMGFGFLPYYLSTHVSVVAKRALKLLPKTKLN